TRRLVKDGARVVMVDLPAQADLGARHAADLGATFVAGDITSAGEIAAAFDTALGLGPVRGLVHCAGRGSDRVRILDREGRPASVDTFADVVRTNLVGTYNVLTQAAA